MSKLRRKHTPNKMCSDSLIMDMSGEIIIDAECYEDCYYRCYLSDEACDVECAKLCLCEEYVEVKEHE